MARGPMQGLHRLKAGPGGAEESQQCHKYFLQYGKFTPKNLRFEHWGTKLVAFPVLVTVLGPIQNIF